MVRAVSERTTRTKQDGCPVDRGGFKCKQAGHWDVVSEESVTVCAVDHPLGETDG